MSEPYRRELSANRNRFRWVEYSMSATLMIVTIATTLESRTSLLESSRRTREFVAALASAR